MAQTSTLFHPKIRYILLSKCVSLFWIMALIGIIGFAITYYILPAVVSPFYPQRTPDFIQHILLYINRLITVTNFIICYVVLTLLSSFRTILNYYFTSIELQPQKIRVIKGVFSKKQVVIPLHAIRTIKKHQSLTERLIGTGRLRIATSSGTATWEIYVGYLSAEELSTISTFVVQQNSCSQ